MSLSQKRLGILLVNLGSPDAATPEAVKRYLKEFLSDKRVVGLPAIVWQPILRGIILRSRPAKVALKYQAVWRGDFESDGAPLKQISYEQAQSLAQQLPYRVYVAMRYQNPSVESVITQMIADGIEHFVILPMYPQYSTTTTLTAIEEVERCIKRHAAGSKMTVVKDYHDHPQYIEQIAHSIQAHWAQVGQPNWAAGDKLLMSFHGIPEALVKKGDPYQTQCEQTFNRVISALGLTTKQAVLVYQSRFGAQKWLQPYAIETLKQLADQGTKRVDILCPGFAADCLETLEEVAQELRDEFLHAGGQAYHYIPCLNQETGYLAKILTDVCQQQG